MRKFLLIALPTITIVAAFFLFQKKVEAPQNSSGSTEAVENIVAPVSENKTEIGQPSKKVEATNNQVQNSSESFQEKLKAAEQSIPKIADIKKLSNEAVHHTPEILIQAADKIGEIEDMVEKNPSFAPKAIAFYEKCAKDSEASSSVRALCFHNQKELAKKNGNEVDEKSLPAEVLRLVKKLEE